MIKAKDVEIRIESHKEFKKSVGKELEKIVRGKYPAKPIKAISFHSLREINRVLTPNRLELLSIIREEEPESIYQLAKLSGRDVVNVNKDVHLLEEIGLVGLSESKDERKKVKPVVDFDKINIGVLISHKATT